MFGLFLTPVFDFLFWTPISISLQVKIVKIFSYQIKKYSAIYSTSTKVFSVNLNRVSEPTCTSSLGRLFYALIIKERIPIAV